MTRTRVVAGFAALALGLSLAGGCSENILGKKIPADSQLMAEGDKDIAFQAPSDGTVYFMAVGEGEMFGGYLVATWPVKKGDDVAFKYRGSESELKLGDKVMTMHAPDGASRRFYFRPG